MIDSLYVSIDGNNIGKLLERHIFCDDLDALSAFSQTLTNHINSLHRYILACEGIVYLAGGDNILALVPSQHITQVIKETRSLEDNGITFSIGIGKTAVAAYLALKYAKSSSSSDPVCCSDHTFSPYHNPIDPGNIN